MGKIKKINLDYLPDDPQSFYRERGWKGYRDFYGDTLLTHEEARNFAISLNLKNMNEWSEYCKSGKKPNNIPATPGGVYKNKGWISWGYFLGTGNVRSGDEKFLPFIEAREFVRKLNLKNEEEWREYYRNLNKPCRFPASPATVYKDQWTSMGDWLGTGFIAHKYRNFLPFKKARKFVRDLNLKGEKEWRSYYLSGEKPDDIPTNPNVVYKDKGWFSMGDWLGTGSISSRKRTYLPFVEARIFVRKLKLKNFKEWMEYCKSGKRPNNIPSGPCQIYKNKGWKSNGDWLGTGTIDNRKKKFISFKDAKKFVLSLDLKSYKEWNRYCKSGKKPKGIPSLPSTQYPDEWKGWGDFLGTGFVSCSKRNYVSLKDAKKFVMNLELKNEDEWLEYCKLEKKPNNIPTYCRGVYKKDKSWKGMGDFLGKKK